MDRRRGLMPWVTATVDSDSDEHQSESEEEEDEDENEEQEDTEDHNDGEEAQAAVSVSARVSQPEPASSSPVVEVAGEGAMKREKETTQGGSRMASILDGGDGERGGEWNREEMEGLFCPICFEAWSSSGEHYPCCLPCGHLYGMSCVRKWFRQRRGSSKCPQCNTKCTMKDVRRIYGSRVLVADDELQKRIQSLEAKCDSLEKKNAEWHKHELNWLRKEAEWQKRETDLCMQLERERTKNIEQSFDAKGGLRRCPVGDGPSQEWQSGYIQGSKLGSSVSSHCFVLQKELQVSGGRFFDIDAAGQLLIIARGLSGLGGRSAVTKMNLFYPHDQEDINLPSSVKAVKDLHVSPFSRLALLATLGKKLSIVNLESNNVVLSYDLTVPAWSCSWDTQSSHQLYAGLQNGMLLVFDTRQTARPLESRNGLTCNPIHTIYPLSTDTSTPSSVGSILTASSIGLCEWSIGRGSDKPFLVPGTENEGVCISLTYCCTNDYLVTTYRPKIEMASEVCTSQAFLTPSSSAGQSVQGSHILFKRMGRCYEKLGSKFANVPSIRLPKAAILDMKSSSAFAFADEKTSDLVLHQLPSLAKADRLKSYYPIRDLKYNSSLQASPLVCLSEDKLQLFSQRLS